MKGWIAILLFVLMGCLPETGKEKTNCGTNEAFNTVTRRCYSVEAPRTAPTATLQESTITEDSNINSITLNYQDANNDYAVACNIISYSSTIDGNGGLPVACSCVGGICTAQVRPDLNFSGTAQFVYTVTDIDGDSNQRTVRVNVTAVDDAPVASSLVPGATITGSSFNEDGSGYVTAPFFSITLGHTDTEGDLATACQINAISANLTQSGSCLCTGVGLCSVTLLPKADFFGNGEFVTYQVFANGQWSNSATVVLNITAVNDLPVNPADQPTGPTDDPQPLTEGTGGFAFTVEPGTDVDNLATELTYTLDAGPSLIDVTGCLGIGAVVGRDCLADTVTPGTAYIENLNDEYRHATIEIGTNPAAFFGVAIGNAHPSMRYRAKAAGTSAGDIKIKYDTGGTAGAELVTVAGNDIVIQIEDDKTTSNQIKAAIEANATANNMVEVTVLGSVTESSQNNFFFFDHVNHAFVECVAVPPAACSGATNMTGGIKLSKGAPGINLPLDQLTYKITDPSTLGPTAAVTVTFSIDPADDVLDDNTNIQNEVFTGDEDTTLTFNLFPGANVLDLTDVLSYRLLNGPLSSDGTLKDCLDLTGSDGPQDLTCTFEPVANFSGTVTCEGTPANPCSYEVRDSAGNTDTVEFQIDITDVDDEPIVCQFSTYEQAPECGLAGCIGSATPVGSIAPTSHAVGKAVYYYASNEKKCYYSTGTTASDWSVDTNGFLASYEINQDEVIEVSNIRVNEGSADESAQSVAILQNVTSSDTALVPLTNITFSHVDGNDGDVPTPQASIKASDIAANIVSNAWLFGTGGDVDDVSALGLKIIPVAGLAGSTTITLTFADEPDTGDYSADTTVTEISFSVTVSSVAASHKGWKNISAVGPKLDKNGKTLDGAKVCSYTRTKCNGGGACRGSTTPSGNAVADEFNAIYLNEADPLNPSCYRAVAQKTIQNIKYTAKTDRMVAIEYVNVVGVTSVDVFDDEGNVPGDSALDDNDEFVLIRVNINTGVTTTNQIIALINGHAEAKELVEMENLQYSATQVVTSTPTALNVGASQLYKTQNVLWMARSADPITFEYASTTGNPFFSVTGNSIVARVNGTDDNATLVAAAGSSVTSLVKYVLIDGATVPIAAASTTMTSISDGLYWSSFDVYCPITESDRLADCRDKRMGASCIGFKVPNDAGYSLGAPAGIVGEDEVQHLNEAYFDKSTSICYRNFDVAYGNLTTWDKFKGSSSVTLSWEAFEVSSGAITGYNIYRKVSNYHDGANPIIVSATERVKVNNTVVPSTATSFTDNWQSSRFPPIPRTVYFYEVRPLIDGKEAVTNDSFSKIRVLAPGAGLAFVHRWMVNRNICQLMHSEERDDQTFPEDFTMQGPGDNYKCKYVGPGSDGGFYDIGKDLVVDRYEAGCPYSTTGCVDTAYANHDGTCIGVVAPEDASVSWENPPAIGSIYYDRSTGVCWRAIDDDGSNGDNWDSVSNGAGSAFAGISDVTNFDVNTSGFYRGAYLPPISNITQDFAQDFCSSNSLDETTDYGRVVGMNLGAAITMSLPNRREQIGYSQWSYDLADSDVEVLEAGLSLNSSSKCNSSTADGLSGYFNEARVPDVNRFYTLPGTTSSNIRSFVTGSTQTASCVSRYGMQDVIGNVAELTIDRMRCESSLGAGPVAQGASTGGYGLSRCEMITPNNDNELTPAFAALPDVAGNTLLDGTYYLTSSDNWPSSTWDTSGSAIFSSSDVYRLDGKVGPCNSNGGLFCDSPMISWTIDEESYSATRMSIPMGLPFHSDFNISTYPTTDTTNSLMDIGPSNGITSAQLHDDVWAFNTDYVYAELDGCGAMTAGGGYESQTGAGVWNLEFVPCSDDIYGYYLAYNLIAFKDLDLTPSTMTIDVEAGATFVLPLADDTSISIINAGATTSNTALFGDLGGLVRANLAGQTDKGLDGDDVTDILLDPFEDFSNVLATRPSVGFRCLGRVNSNSGGHYYEDQ